MRISFAGGKFDLNKSSALPLSAFSSAMSSLAQIVVACESVRLIKDGIKDAIKREDIMFIISVMPDCEELFDFDDESYNPAQSIGGKEAISRLQYAIRRLLKVICTHLKGVVLFLDDLQWTDVPTIELLKSIAMDKEIPSLLLVGAYREDEVSDSHPLMLQIKDMKDEGVETTTLRIGNISQDNVTHLVTEALRMEGNEDSVSTLAETIYKKTSGNAFYVIIFLKSLHEEGLLSYNFGVMKWIWNDKKVRTKLVTQNVASILINKLKRFDSKTQIVLQVAACIGASFATSTVSKIVKGLRSNQTKLSSNDEEYSDCSSLSSTIREMEVEGLWEKESDSPEKRRFSHDQIQSAAFELITPEKRNTFRGEIGGILRNIFRGKELEENLFIVVGLRNFAKDSVSGEECLDLARTNLRAGLKASRNAAFDSAAVYYRTGRELLGTNAWDTNSEMMLQLCSEEANACFINGDIERMDLLIDEVLGKDLPIQDKFQCYEVKILAAQAASKFNYAIDTANEVRRQLGLPTLKNKPASTPKIIIESIKTGRMLGKRTPDDIANLPVLKDERIIMGQRMLELILNNSYQVQPTLYPLAVLLLVRTSIKHGINASSCDAFSCYGLILCGFMGKLKRGREMGAAVELILANPNIDTAQMQSRACFHDENIYHWTSPIQASLAPLLSGYQKGLEIGDIESASMCLLFRSEHLWYTGRPLDGVLLEQQTNARVLAVLNRPTLRMYVLPYILAAKKLRNISWHDDDLDFERICSFAADTKNNTLFAFAKALQFEMYVYLYSQEIDFAMNILEEAANLREGMIANFAGVHYTFLEALIALKAAQAAKTRLGKKKWKSRAARSMKMVRNWLKNGNGNVVHAMSLLNAELAVLRGNKSKADEQFKQAISVATKHGFIQDKALAHELFGRYHAAQGDASWASYHLDLAERSYSDWGATRKVEQLAEQRRALLEKQQ